MKFEQFFRNSTLSGILLLFFLLGNYAAAAADTEGCDSGFLKRYGFVNNRQNPKVKWAAAVFRKVAAAADKRKNILPKLCIIPHKSAAAENWIQVLPDGSIILVENVLDFVYGGGSKAIGNSKLAFLFGHELAHLAKDDFWFSLAFSELNDQIEFERNKTWRLPRILGRFIKIETSVNYDLKKAREKELQADSYGIIYMTLAGFDPAVIVRNEGNTFFDEWINKTRSKDCGISHPCSPVRIQEIKSRLRSVADHLEFFHSGVRLYQLGLYKKAIPFFEAFRERFPGREVLNNLGLSHFKMAMDVLADCDEALAFKFKMSAILDLETLGTKTVRRIGASFKKTSDKKCFEDDRFVFSIKQADHLFNLAIASDPFYTRARINLSSSLIMAGKYAKALGELDEVLVSNPNNFEARSNRVLALYLFGKKNKYRSLQTAAIEKLRDISRRHPDFVNAPYNLAMLLQDMDNAKNTEAVEAARLFLQKEPTGNHAAVLRAVFHLQKRTVPVDSKSCSHIASSVMPGRAREKELKVLRNMQKRTIRIGEFEAEHYQRGKEKILVAKRTTVIRGHERTERNIEFVESPLPSTIGLRKFKQIHGEPDRIIHSFNRKTLMYRCFGVDIVDDEVSRFFNF